MKIFKIVLTGGPCAGKTKVLNGVRKNLEEDGYYVITVPETAESLIGGKIIPYEDIIVKFQEQILDIQKAKEDNAIEYAECLAKILESGNIINKDLKEYSKSKGIIIIFDRGLLDNRAYLPHDEYNNLLKRKGINELSRLDNYDMVIDLISMANLKKEAYQNSDIRSEDDKLAKDLDIKTSGAWLIYDDLITVKPTNTIDEKINYVYQLINNYIKNDVKPKKVREKVEIDNEFYDILNEDNSRNLKTKKTKIEYNENIILELYKIMYGDNIDITKSCILKENEITLSKEKITFEDYCYLLSKYTNREVDERNMIRFVDAGNIYSIINDGENTYLETNQESIKELPKLLKLKKKGI